jgi:hypothetical protein
MEEKISMAELYFQFEKDTDSDLVAKEVQDGLLGLDSVKTAETQQSPVRVPLVEILAVVTVGVQVVHHAKEITTDLRAIISNLKAGFDDISAMARGLKATKVFTLVGGKRKSITELTEEDYRSLAEEEAATDIQ